MPSVVSNPDFSSQFDTMCKLHPHEKIKYYCKDDQTALCPDCVVDHARHDFIMANDVAGRLIKE